MLRTLTACAAILSAFAVPAGAADLAPYSPYPWPSPYYVVNQGPVFSGPGIMVIDIGYTVTGLSQPYPFVGPCDASAYDDYGTMPLDPAARFRSRSRACYRYPVRKGWRRKPVSVRY